MAKAPSFPFYPTDFLGDVRVIPMDAEQVGMYTLLMCCAWQESPRGTLPDNEEILAKYARVSVEVWREKSELILRCFKKKNGRLFQARLMQEAKKKADWIKKCKVGGIKSGEVRAKGSSTTPEDTISLILNPLLNKFNNLIRDVPVYKKVKPSYLAELAALYPKVNPETVLEKLRAWEMDKNRQTKNPSLRLRNWFENELKFSGNGQTSDQTFDHQKKAAACFYREPEDTRQNPNSCRGTTGAHCRECEKKKPRVKE